jgi:histidinol-phosphate aminotransferase
MTEPARPAPQPGIIEIAPYVPGKARLAGAQRVIKLSSNETPFGPSAAAIEAFRGEAGRLALYPDGSAVALREAIAALHGLEPSRIVCGAGSDELLNLLAQAYLGPGDEAVYTRHGFLVYPIAIRAAGATPVVAEETDLAADVDAILACVTQRTKLVFLANPNNPTGTWLPRSEIARLIAGLPGHVLLVLDAAYAEYVDEAEYDAGASFVRDAQNVVMTRTFSKIYGLASLRIGWAYCPAAIASVLDRIRGPFNLSGPAIAAGVAALGDPAHVAAAAAHNRDWRGRAATGLADLGLRVTRSAGNFLLIHFPDAPGLGAAEADAHLQSRGVIVRRVTEYGFPNALRVTIGAAEDMELFLGALADFTALRRSA